MLMQPFAQSEPMAGGAAVNVASGVNVGGAGVELGSPGITVSVGTGVNVTVGGVIPGEAVHVGKVNVC